MKKKLKPEEFNSALIDTPVNLFGHELIRTELLTNLLGKDAEAILYWAGKELARNHPLTSYEEVVQFSNKLLLELSIVRKKNALLLHTVFLEN